MKKHFADIERPINRKGSRPSYRDGHKYTTSPQDFSDIERPTTSDDARPAYMNGHK